MARFTLSIADDVAAQLDAYAAENNLNRSQAAEHLFRQAFAQVEPSEQTEELSVSNTVIDVEYLTDRLLEVQDYLTRVCSAHQSLRNYVVATVSPEDASFAVNFPRQLPAPPWAR